MQLAAAPTRHFFVHTWGDFQKRMLSNSVHFFQPFLLNAPSIPLSIPYITFRFFSPSPSVPGCHTSGVCQRGFGKCQSHVWPAWAFLLPLFFLLSVTSLSFSSSSSPSFCLLFFSESWMCSVPSPQPVCSIVVPPAPPNFPPPHTHCQFISCGYKNSSDFSLLLLHCNSDQ